ncbi:MAG: leucyl/phenylalanyl-tRNA--protein transferase [Acidimicrobiia bacterium]|nr:leucyl/phenylalanyl-tRNA--protein transferase [Acidimicrobiia bacterium]
MGADLDPGTLLAAYRRGIFPMPVGPDEVTGWWSPDPRAILPLDSVHVSRSLQRSLNKYTVTFGEDFAGVVAGCANPARPHGWITADMQAAYARLFELGWADSIEVWGTAGSLVGGLYGVRIGGFFAGESMFHRARDASKVALVRMAGHVAETGGALFDVQWQTPHLESMGAIEVPRADYLTLLAAAL